MLLPTALLTLSLMAQAPKPNPYLAQAKVFNQGLEYEKCLQRLDQASKWPSSAKEQVEIELYAGLCSFGAGRREDARQRFALALQLDPKVTLPPFTSPKIAELFGEVQKQFDTSTATATPPPPVEPKPEIATPPASPEEKVSLAPRDTALAPRRPWLELAGKDAAVPASLAVGAVAATGAAVYLGVMASSLAAEANAAPFQADTLRIGGQAQTAALWSNVGYAVAGAALVSGVTVFLLTPAAN